MTNLRSSGIQWNLRYQDQAATVVEVGGGLRSYAVGGAEILDGYGEDEICPASAGHVLAPWPNRVRDGRYRFGDHAYQLALSEPPMHNAIHGLVQWVRWHAVLETENSVTVEYVLPPHLGYPWELELQTSYTLGSQGLRIAHTARNLSDRPAPFGLGTHPYLRVPDVAIDDLTLSIPARTRLLVDSRKLPIGAAKVAGSDFDYSEPRRLGETVLDTAFGDLIRDEQGGSAVTMTAPDGRAVHVWADAAFNWWQLYTAHTLAGPRRRRSVAIEPMTCPPDALRSGRDLVILAAGGTWRGEWIVRGIL